MSKSENNAKIPKGVYITETVTGKVLYRASVTKASRHISLGSYPDVKKAHKAYLTALKVLENNSISLTLFASGNDEHLGGVRRPADFAGIVRLYAGYHLAERLDGLYAVLYAVVAALRLRMVPLHRGFGLPQETPRIHQGDL